MCNNVRSEDDPRGCCTARGSKDLIDHAKKRIKEMGLKGQVRVNKAGCLDACAYGPTVVVYPEDVWYTPRSREDLEEFLNENILNDRIVDRLVIQFNKKPSN